MNRANYMGEIYDGTGSTSHFMDGYIIELTPNSNS